MVPVAGSAYTYSYVAFGEIIAWLIGWSLIMEYSIGNIAVAISWSDYFTGLLSGLGVHLPEYITMDYFSAYRGHKEAVEMMGATEHLTVLPENLKAAYLAWTNSPSIAGLHLIADIPALVIIILITALVYRGIKESKTAGNLMVLVKLCIILVVIAVGAFYVNPTNWSPFAPNGIAGILKGISAVFFAYIGFDAISTTAEECKDPQKDLPKGMMYSIIICTILYVIIALVLTGMVKYDLLAVGDPLAFVFDKLGLKWMSGIIAVSAVVAMASVLLVFQLGQPRIWLSMSRDGLLPQAFSKVHPKFRTPSFATIMTGIIVAVPALFMNLTAVTDLCSIGTLFAFVLVCGGVLKLQNSPDAPPRKFKTPYINSKFIVPALFVLATILSFTYNKEASLNFILNRQLKDSEALYSSLSEEQIALYEEKLGLTTEENIESAETVKDLRTYMNKLNDREMKIFVKAMSIEDDLLYTKGWNIFKNNIPYWVFILCMLIMVYLCYTYSLSLIPTLGLISCVYMMSEMGMTNWIGFTIWLIVGLIIYFAYSVRHSKLNHKA